MNVHVLLAVFKRNFTAYFTNPLGYVFVWVFVFLSTIAAFWQTEFFNANLANLDQLTTAFPYIMLVFIPAITMGIWADERRQGTDELLLTIPAGDLEVVVGKYLSAVAIYTVSLLFSLLCNYFVLETLGNPDLGLFLGTYVGYWFVGLAMLALGMIGSFLTRNLTVAFILGALLNLPLVVFDRADTILPTGYARALSAWSVSERLAEFGSGVLSLSSMVYFLVIVVVSLYLCMILISRRHWARGMDWVVQAGHYGVRTLALLVVAACVVLVLQWHDVRADVTSERINSVSPSTANLLRELEPERPVQIEAFISPEVPEAYVQTRQNLIRVLREIKALAGPKVELEIHSTEPFSENAVYAEKRYAIEPESKPDFTRGSVSETEIFMGVAVTSGLERVILPFIDRGIPVEYELVRSIATVTDQERRTIGIVETDAPLYGQFNMQAMGPGADWPIIAELEKQYNVVKIDPAQPIEEEVDVLLTVQPSSLGPEAMDNFVAAVQRGVPTAIFEDPLPVFAGGVPATSMPRQAPQQNPMFGRQQPPPKGDIERLWRMLGIDFAADQVIWQKYNPYPKAGTFPDEFVFVDSGAVDEPFNQDSPPVADMQQVLFPFPGALSKLQASGLDFTWLARTGDETGTVRMRELLRMGPFGQPMGMNENPRRVPTELEYIMAARVQGEVPAPADDNAEEDADAADQADEGNGDAASTEDEAPEGDQEDGPKMVDVDVIIVTDIDMLTTAFFELREQGTRPEAGFYFDFDNVPFVLNILDSLAGDDRFIDIRTRRPEYRTLTKIEERTEEARKETAEDRQELREKYEEAQREEQDKLNEEIEKLRARMEKEDLDPMEVATRVQMVLNTRQRRLDIRMEQLEKEMDRKVKQTETDLALAVRRVQDTYKMWAVLLPPILPLALAIVVMVARRSGEREGVAETRLRRRG